MVSSLSSGPFSDFSASACCDSLRKRAGPDDREVIAEGAAAVATSVADVCDDLRGGGGPAGGGPGGGTLGGPREASCLWGTGGGTPGGWKDS